MDSSSLHDSDLNPLSPPDYQPSPPPQSRHTNTFPVFSNRKERLRARSVTFANAPDSPLDEFPFQPVADFNSLASKIGSIDLRNSGSCE
jgi:hypothetical protein